MEHTGTKFLEVRAAVTKEFYQNCHTRLINLAESKELSAIEGPTETSKAVAKVSGHKWQTVHAVFFIGILIVRGELPQDWKEFYLLQHSTHGESDFYAAVRRD